MDLRMAEELNIIFFIGVGPADHDGKIGRSQALRLLQDMLIRGQDIIEEGGCGTVSVPLSFLWIIGSGNNAVD